MRTRSFRFDAIALSSAVLTTAFAVTGAAQAPLKSVKDGVFTAAQATRGGAIYEEKCTSCHAARMWGHDWPEKTLFDVYDTIKNFMPEDSPGSLSAQQTRDVVAYILRANRLPAGQTELPGDDEALRQIRLEMP
jgi:S-disulfanyl-L-cysteine oxidoreductase SoxD